MSDILYINGFKIDLEAGQKIAQTKQVNDIANIENRQANYTNRFRGANTANNRRAFDFLSQPGNTSNIPYQRNETYLYGETGECFIYKGWANVTNASKGGYDIYVYDGIIDIYKAIENKTLSDLGLTELNHLKNLETVLASWDGAVPYIYILADYGGKMYYDTNTINIDYLVPSVPYKFLMDKIFANAGATYSGAIFATGDFLISHLTYPKGLPPIDEESYTEIGNLNQGPIFGRTARKYVTLSDGYATVPQLSLVDEMLISSITASYKFNFTGKLNKRSTADLLINNDVTNIKLFAVKGQAPNTNVNDLNLNSAFTILENINFETDIDEEYITSLNELESIAFVLVRAFDDTINRNFELLEGTDMNIVVSFTSGTNIDFGAALIDFSQKEFLNDVMIKFGLTVFKDKYTNDYTFLTLQERLQTADIVDWSKEYLSVESESYVHGNYAQKNIFSYNYNDKEASYNDGAISIDNVNLPNSKPVIQSKIYSPERELFSRLAGQQVHTYKLWEKEVTSSLEIIYKALEKRFYNLKFTTVDFETPILIGSERLETSTLINSAPIESFSKLSFSELIDSFYPAMTSILNKSLLQVVKLWLTDSQVANLDFKKLYYIEQESSYYLLNKLMNYIPRKSVNAEMIRVQYSRFGENVNPLTLNYVYFSETQLGFMAIIGFTNATGLTNVILKANDVEVAATPTLQSGDNYIDTMRIYTAGIYDFQVIIGAYSSNIITVNIF